MKMNKDTIRCYRFFGKFAWHTDKKYFLLLIISFIVNSLAPFITIIGTQYLIDEIADAAKRNIGMIVFWIAFICIGTFLDKNINKYISENLAKIGEKFDRILKTKLCMSCIKMPFANTENTEILDTIKNAGRSLDETGQVNSLIAPVFNMASNFMVALGVIGLICTRIPWLMIPVVVSFATNSKITSKINKSRRKFFKVMGNVERGSSYFNTELMESRYAKDVRLYNASEIFVDKYDGYIDRIYKTSKKYHLGYIRYSNIGEVFYAICDMSIYLLLVINIIKKAITIGEFSSLFEATNSFNGAIRSIINSYLGISYSVSVLKFYVDFVENIYDNDDELRNMGNMRYENIPSVSEIEFRNVSFKYPNTDKYILKNISVKINAGEHLSIVGQNGAGKTTFIKLLCRLYENYEGEILVNDKEIREYDFIEYMLMLSVVFQDFRLFAFTIRDNVTAFRRKKADLEEIYKIAGVDKWLDKLDKKDETYIYKMFVEDGVEPSGGEGQKLAIARALYKDAPIVVLDEPTAALDPISEYEVYKNFDKLVQNKTAVYISHRLSSCRFCDRIIVFDDGKLIEEGTHEELVALEKGFYSNMYKTQANQYNLHT